MRGARGGSRLAAVAGRAWCRACSIDRVAAVECSATARGSAWWHVATRRNASASGEASPASPSGRRPCYGGDAGDHLGLPFTLSAEDAHAALKRWAGQKPFRPWTLRDGAKRRPSLRAVFLPHWVFDCEVSTRYRGSVGYDAGGGKHEWTRIETWRDGGTTPYPSTATQSQICASFKHRRDLVSAVAGAHVGALPYSAQKENGVRRAIRRGAPATTETLSEVTLRPMPSVRDAVLEAARHGAGAPNTIEAERFGMKRSLAWELCFRRIREREREKAKAALLEAHGADAVKDIALDIDLSPGRVVRAVRLPRLSPRSRTARRAGPTATSRRAQRRRRVRDDWRSARRRGRRRYRESARTRRRGRGPRAGARRRLGARAGRARAARRAGLAGLGGGVRAGGRRRRAPLGARARRARVRDESEAFAAAMRHGGPGDHAWMDESTQRRRDDAEWGRWKETDKQNWEEGKREEWAANIWQWQRLRRREREERRAQLEAERSRLEEAERRDEEKERRWGPGWRKASGAGTGRGGSGGRDTKGFYKLLGLREKLGEATAEEIKSAYRKEAMAWHPDKHQGEKAKTRAAKAFRSCSARTRCWGTKPSGRCTIACKNAPSPTKSPPVDRVHRRHVGVASPSSGAPVLGASHARRMSGRYAASRASPGAASTSAPSRRGGGRRSACSLPGCAPRPEHPAPLVLGHMARSVLAAAVPPSGGAGARGRPEHGDGRVRRHHASLREAGVHFEDASGGAAAGRARAPFVASARVRGRVPHFISFYRSGSPRGTPKVTPFLLPWLVGPSKVIDAPVQLPVDDTQPIPANAVYSALNGLKLEVAGGAHRRARRRRSGRTIFLVKHLPMGWAATEATRDMPHKPPASPIPGTGKVCCSSGVGCWRCRGARPCASTCASYPRRRFSTKPWDSP